MQNNRHSRAARAIAAQLATKPYIRVNVSTPAADSYIFHVMVYLCRYFGSYQLEYTNDNMAIIRKLDIAIIRKLG